MSYKPHPHENPAGADSPPVRFRWTQKQVLLALLGVAVLSAVWQYCQYNLMVPRVPVKWSAFDQELVEAAERRQDLVLIRVAAKTDAGGEPGGENVLESSPFRKAVFRSRCITIQIDSESEAGTAALQWMNDRLRGIADGETYDFSDVRKGHWLVLISGSKTRPRVVAVEPDTNADSIVSCLFD